MGAEVEALNANHTKAMADMEGDLRKQMDVLQQRHGQEVPAAAHRM